MVDFASLRDARFDDLEAAGRAWHNYSEHLRGSAELYGFDVLGGVGRSGWKGRAAETAKNEMTPELERLKRAAFTAFTVYNALSVARKEFSRAQRELCDAVDEAHSLHIRVGDDGSLTPPPLSAADRHDPESLRAWNATRQRLSERMRTAIDKATKADEQLAAVLPELFAENAWREDLPTGLTDRPPLWSGTDFGRPFGVESPTGRDRETYEKLQFMVLGGVSKGWPTASTLLSHWLDGNGDTKHVNVAEIMKRSPEMRHEIEKTLGEHPGPGRFDSGWRSANFDHRTNLDMYYAFNGYQYRVVGEGGHYTVEFYKRYNFGTAEENRLPINAPLLGSIKQPDISHLHTAGLARDFDVYGSSGFQR